MCCNKIFKIENWNYRHTDSPERSFRCLLWLLHYSGSPTLLWTKFSTPCWQEGVICDFCALRVQMYFVQGRKAEWVLPLLVRVGMVHWGVTLGSDSPMGVPRVNHWGGTSPGQSTRPSSRQPLILTGPLYWSWLTLVPGIYSWESVDLHYTLYTVCIV